MLVSSGGANQRASHLASCTHPMATTAAPPVSAKHHPPQSQRLRIIFTPATVFLLFSSVLVLTTADPQTNLLNAGCSPFNMTGPDFSFFRATVNASLTDIRKSILQASPDNGSSTASSSHFATAEYPRNSTPVYALFQCRDYLSPSDCLACFETAAAQIRHNCPSGNGARVIYDGCMLRYESRWFYDQAAQGTGSDGKCDPRTVSLAGFTQAVDELLTKLVAAVPKINGFFAAAASANQTAAVDSSRNTSSALVYGVAQCVRNTTEAKCAECLKVARDNIGRCPPAEEARAIDAGCFLRYSAKPFFPINQTLDLAPFLVVDGNGSGPKNKAAIIGGAVAGTAVLLALVLGVWWVHRSRQSNDRRGDILGATELQGPLNFHYKDLRNATKSFSEHNKLGEGGFGDVYKGVLKNGKIVAVKKLAIRASNRAQVDFKAEVTLISNVHHRNLIRLLGCASKGANLLLVYEYMAHSSLDKHLFGEKEGSLSWKQRFDIIVGTARGLAYLHEEYHACIIHRDIKSSNILLDDDFQPKIADFGLARLLPDDQTHLTTKVAGTLGYTAPEYAILGQLSEKVDTFSYGVVVLEIISGRKSTDIKLEPVTRYLLEWAWTLYEEEKLLDLVDTTLDNSYNVDDMKKVIEIALLCTQSNVAARPTMSQVVMMLLGNEAPTTQLIKPTFIADTNKMYGSSSQSLVSNSSTSNATISVSRFSAR